MSLNLSADNFEFITCSPAGTGLAFRAYCPSGESEDGDSAFVQIRVQLVSGDECTPIGWYNVDMSECVGVECEGEGSEFNHPQYADHSLWAVESSGRRVVTCFSKDPNNELLHITAHREHLVAILEMCRAQTCKQMGFRALGEATPALPVKYR